VASADRQAHYLPIPPNPTAFLQDAGAFLIRTMRRQSNG
jgi:hypothetical protein